MFKEKFTRLCNERNVAPSAVCIKLGLSNAAYSLWNEKSIPRESTLIKIADYFGVTVEYLKGEEKEKTPTKVDEFTELFSQLTDEQKKLVVAQMKGIISNQ